MINSTQYSNNFNSKLIFYTILFSVPLSQSAIDLYSPSLPQIEKDFSTNANSVQQTLSFFFFSLGLGQFIYGPISDSIGRKKTLIIGLVGFLITTFMCYFSPNISFLIFSRFLQGFACGALAVLPKAITVDLFKGIDLMKATALIGLIWGSAPILAPVLGGYLDVIGGWRLSFLVLAIYGLVSLISVIFLFKETHHERQKINVGNILRNSLIVSKNKNFLCCTIIIAVTNLGQLVFNFMAPFFIQNVMGKSPIYYGYTALVVGIVYILGAFLSRFVIKYIEGEKVIRLSVNCILFIVVVMAIFSFAYPKSIFILMFTSSSIAFISGLLYPYLLNIMFQPFQKHLNGTVSSCYGVITYLFSGIIMYLFSFLTVTSVKEVLYAYLFVGIFSYISMRKLF